MSHMTANYQSLVREAAMVIPGAQNFPVTYDVPAGATQPVATVNRDSLMRAVGAKINTESKMAAQPKNNRHQKYERAFAAQRHAPRPSARAGILSQTAGTQMRLKQTLNAHTPNATVAQVNARIAATSPAPMNKTLPVAPQPSVQQRAARAGLKLLTAAIDPFAALGSVGAAFNGQVNAGRSPQRRTGVAATYAKLGVGLPTPTFG